MQTMTFISACNPILYTRCKWIG